MIDNMTRTMPWVTKRKVYLSEIGKAQKKKRVVLTIDGSVSNVSSNTSDGSAVPAKYI